MSTEERLREAFRGAEAYQPSPDLWARVEGSIEEDKAHRRRLRRLTLAVSAALAFLLAVGAAAREVGRYGLQVDWRVMEILEVVALVALVMALGPAIRRFGRGYAGEVFLAHPPTSTHFLRVLDVAYYLVFSGYVLLTTRFQMPDLVDGLSGQLDDLTLRIGGLLMLMGGLHGITIAVLPLIGLVFTSGWRRGIGRPRREIPPGLLIIAVGLLAGTLLLVGFVLAGFGTE